ncbi:UNVERIFIED_ORG: hypothetical protein J2Y84_004294 [Pseudomonas reinekei]|nr:hypothetical protein [Pseudomonas reinekei]MDF9902656.1 hypothetical protein [Pseudomonas reinekei]
MYTAARYFGEMARLQAMQGDFAIILAPTLGPWPLKIPVGASLLAMEVNDDVGSLAPRGALRFFASKLAPTGDWVYL